MSEQAFYCALALDMATTQADYLLNDDIAVPQQTSVGEAIGLIRDCLQHLERPAQALAIALGCHPIVERTSAWTGWATALDRLRAEKRLRASVVEQIQLLNYRSQAARELGDFETALATASLALQLAEAQQNRGLAAVSLNKLGLIALSRDEIVAARTYLEQAYGRGKTSLPTLEVGHIRMNLGIIAVKQGEYSKAHHCFNEALGYYQTEGDELHMAKAQANVADLMSREGRLDESLKLLWEAHSVFQTLGARHNYGLVLNDLGCVYLRLGKFNRALRAFEEALVTFEEIGGLNGKARVLSNVAELYVTTKQWEKAKETIQEARRVAIMCERPLLVSIIDVDWGRMQKALGDYVGARQLWTNALEVQRSQGAGIAEYTQQLLDGLPNDAE